MFKAAGSDSEQALSDEEPDMHTLYPIHRGNIQERRCLAIIARFMPLLMWLTTLCLIVVGALYRIELLLVLCAFFNVSFAAAQINYAIWSFCGIIAMARQLREPQDRAARVPLSNGNGNAYSTARQAFSANSSFQEEELLHLIIIANYKEDEETMANTLQSIAEAEDASSFHVVLACEAREGPSAEAKARSLQSRFQRCFARIEATFHATNLTETNLDGSVDAELPGKSSNLKWALASSAKLFSSSANVMLTVSDADTLYHPSYFSQITKEYRQLKAEQGVQAAWTVWQAPQLPFRNYGHAPAPSRIYAYIQTMHELGGVTASSWGGKHLTFSSFSMPLKLALDAMPWEGNILCDDHHAFLKCYFYHLRAKALAYLHEDEAYSTFGEVPAKLSMRPIFCPMKSTSVVSPEGMLQSWIDRFAQAKRHTHGVAEFPFALLAAWDTFLQLPSCAVSFSDRIEVLRLLGLMFYMSLLPILQFCCLAGLVIHMGVSHGLPLKLPFCMEASSPATQVMCALSGAYFPAWPGIVPPVCYGFVSAGVVWISFFAPAEVASGQNLLWYRQDGQLPLPKCLWLLILVIFDCAAIMGPIMFVYGLCLQISAYHVVALRGNRVEFTVSKKAT